MLKQDFLNDFHRQNQLALNDAILIVPLVNDALILYILNVVGYRGYSVFTLIIALLCFLTATCVLLYSFFDAEKVIDACEKKDVINIKRYNNRVIKENWGVFWLISGGMSLTFLSVLIIGFS